MCGRYQFSVEQCEEIQRIAEMIDQKYGAGAWQPGEIRPTAKAPVLLAGKSGMEPELMSWGYRTAGPLVSCRSPRLPRSLTVMTDAV